MSNIHLTTTQATHEDVNNMVAYNDIIYRTRAKTILKVFLIAFIITGALLGTAFGFRDAILDFVDNFAEKNFGISILEDDHTFKITPVKPESSSDTGMTEMNFELASSNVPTGIVYYPINTLAFDKEYRFTYNKDNEIVLGPDGEFPNKECENNITYELVRTGSTTKTKLQTVNGKAKIPAGTAQGSYKLYARIPETIKSGNNEYYSELNLSTDIYIDAALVEIPDNIVYFTLHSNKENYAIYDEKEYVYAINWSEIKIGGKALTSEEDLPSDLKLTWKILDKYTNKETNLTYLNNNYVIDAGEYRVTITLKNTGSNKNYCYLDGKVQKNLSTVASLNKLLIAKANLNLDLTINDPDASKNLVYNTKPVDLIIGNLPEGMLRVLFKVYETYDIFDIDEEIDKTISNTVEREVDAVAVPAPTDANDKNKKDVYQYVFSGIKDAGDYRIDAEVSLRNYTLNGEDSQTLTTEFSIGKIDLKTAYDLNKLNYSYHYYTYTTRKEIIENKDKTKETVYHMDLQHYSADASLAVYNGTRLFYAIKSNALPSDVLALYKSGDFKYSSDDINYLNSLDTYGPKKLESELKAHFDSYVNKAFIDAGDYEMDLTLSGRNYITYTLGSDEETAKPIFHLKKADYSGIIFKNQSYSYGDNNAFNTIKVKGNIPVGTTSKYSATNTDTNEVYNFTSTFGMPENAGNYKLTLTLVNKNYNDKSYTVVLDINRLAFEGLPTHIVDWKFKNGKNLLTPEVGTYELPEGSTAELKRNGSTEEVGVYWLGSYSYELVFTNPNYETWITPIRFKVVFNPITIAVGALIGILIALILFAIVFSSRRRKDRISRQNFIALRVQLERERGGVVCECRAFASNKFARRKGRLYLTATALEFYDSMYPMNHKNLVILPKDIVDMKAYGLYNTKLAISFRGGWIKIKVPAGTAKLWKKELTHFKNMQQAYYTEVHTLNSDLNEPSRRNGYIY